MDSIRRIFPMPNASWEYTSSLVRLRLLERAFPAFSSSATGSGTLCLPADITSVPETPRGSIPLPSFRIVTTQGRAASLCRTRYSDGCTRCAKRSMAGDLCRVSDQNNLERHQRAHERTASQSGVTWCCDSNVTLPLAYCAGAAGPAEPESRSFEPSWPEESRVESGAKNALT